MCPYFYYPPCSGHIWQGGLNLISVAGSTLKIMKNKCSHFIVVPANSGIVKKKQAKFCKKCKQWFIDDQEKMRMNKFLNALSKIDFKEILK